MLGGAATLANLGSTPDGRLYLYLISPVLFVSQTHPAASGRPSMALMSSWDDRVSRTWAHMIAIGVLVNQDPNMIVLKSRLNGIDPPLWSSNEKQGTFCMSQVSCEAVNRARNTELPIE